MRIVVLTGAGISAESGVPTFRDADGLWEGHRRRGRRHPARPSSGSRRVVHRFYDARRAALADGRAQPGPPRAGPTRGGAGRRPAGRHPEHRRPARARRLDPGRCTCTASSARRCARLRWPVRRGTATSATSRPARAAEPRRCAPTWSGSASCPTSWTGSSPPSRRRPVRLDRHLGRGLPGGRVRAGRVGVRRPHARAQPGPERGQPLLRRGPTRPAPASSCRRGWTSCSGERPASRLR